jgi:hypothetical protein
LERERQGRQNFLANAAKLALFLARHNFRCELLPTQFTIEYFLVTIIASDPSSAAYQMLN